ncbi:MAG: GNAT family N-acetyltransferase [Lewinellaceae bacterium]|nr:GNAT family N-acetyltransferase [Saprospiraceae bacterium]MCB9314365.1 GNAT family N-acetyltransferase [Lewinellaceae bacterium]HRW76518.1 GNAT family N-acetyltransferase [Saprospiraceae bacterium]
MIHLVTVGLDHSIHDREGFACGHPALDNYLSRNAIDDQKEGLARCYVMVDPQNKIAGYYTLTMANVPKESIPREHLNRKIRYEDIPVILLGRLAVDRAWQGKGLGKFLLVDALAKSVEASLRVGARAVVVDPIDDRARDFYLKYGFYPLPDSGKLFLPIRAIRTTITGD